MADRWSNPSGAKGLERFRVWPSGSDSYDHGELQENWDKLDAIIGIPGTGTWPPTEGVGGGIYAEIASARSADVPVGSLFPWFRPVEAMETPEGYEICDGREVAEHEFLNVSGPYTTPDMRNRFALGADPSAPVGEAGADLGSPDADTHLGAPGVGGIGGQNGVTLGAADLAAHRHTGSTTGWSGRQEVWYNDAVPGDSGKKYPQAGNYEVSREGAGSAIGTGAGGWRFGQHQHYLKGLTEEGGGGEHENRPRYVGLIWIVKCRSAA